MCSAAFTAPAKFTIGQAECGALLLDGQRASQRVRSRGKPKTKKREHIPTRKHTRPHGVTGLDASLSFFVPLSNGVFTFIFTAHSVFSPSSRPPTSHTHTHIPAFTHVLQLLRLLYAPQALPLSPLSLVVHCVFSSRVLPPRPSPLCLLLRSCLCPPSLPPSSGWLVLSALLPPLNSLLSPLRYSA